MQLEMHFTTRWHAPGRISLKFEIFFGMTYTHIAFISPVVNYIQKVINIPYVYA